MVCVAKNSTSPALAQFQAFWTIWNWIFVTADNIAADAVTANAIAANAIDGMTITGAIIRTSASWQRVELSSNYFSSYDTNEYERIRLWDSWYKLQFRDDSGNDWWYIVWTYNSILDEWVISTSWSFLVSSALILWGRIVSDMLPYYDQAFSIWSPTYQREHLYIHWGLFFTTNSWSWDSDWVLWCSFWFPTRRSLWGTTDFMPFKEWSTALSWRYVASSSWWSPTSQLWYIPLNVWGTVYKVLYSWII